MAIKLNRKKIKNRLVEKIEELACENVFECYQCGNCSAGCPMVDYMDYPPNQVMKLAQLGEIEELLNANTIWICSTCLQCTSRCPKGIKVAEVMEALRSINLRKRKGIVEADKKDGEDREELPPIALISSFRKLTG